MASSTTFQPLDGAKAGYYSYYCDWRKPLRAKEAGQEVGSRSQSQGGRAWDGQSLLSLRNTVRILIPVQLSFLTAIQESSEH